MNRVKQRFWNGLDLSIRKDRMHLLEFITGIDVPFEHIIEFATRQFALFTILHFPDYLMRLSLILGVLAAISHVFRCILHYDIMIRSSLRS